MSQVKKLQPGGSTLLWTPPALTPEQQATIDLYNKNVQELNSKGIVSNDSKLGSLTIDGIKYDATPDLLNSLSSYLAGTTTLGGLIEALNSGSDLYYDSNGNYIRGMQGKWVGNIPDSARASGRSKWANNIAATFNTDSYKFDKDLSRLSNFRYTKPSEENPVAALINIYGNNDWFDYLNETDENGSATKKWSKQSSKNAQLLERIKNLSDYVRSPEEGAKKYKLNGYSEQEKEALINLYNQNRSDWDTFISVLMDRIKSGNLKQDDYTFLKSFHIIKPSEITQQEEADSALAAAKKRFNDAGYNYDDWKDTIVWDSDKGYWRVSNNILDWLYGENRDKNVNRGFYFNDQFINSAYNPNGGLNYLKGYFIIGDRIYNEKDATNPNSDLYKILRRQGGFRDLNAAMNNTEANNLIEFLWGNQMGWNKPDSNYYSNFFDPSKNYWFRPVTNDYNWNGKELGQQLIQYFIADPAVADEFGFYQPKYKILDEYGNTNLDFVGPEPAIPVGLTPIQNTSGENPFTQRKMWFSESGNSEFDGRYLIGDIVDEDGHTAGAGFWIDPRHPETGWFFESNEMHNYDNDLDNKVIRVPDEISKIFASNPELMKKLLANPELRKKFSIVAAGSVNSNWRSNDDWVTTNVGDWEYLGFSHEDAVALVKACKEWSQNAKLIKTPMAKRRRERLVEKPKLHKQGGTIEKLALGDMIGRAGTITPAATQIKTTIPQRDTGEFANLGKDKLQAHDWIELGAAIADLASVGLGFVPGANVGSALAGFAGSTAGFNADIRRDGFQGTDLLNYGINTVFDSLTLLPVVGGISKSAKAVRVLKKLAPTINKLMKAAAVYGIGDAAMQSWDAIQNGNFTMRDIRAVVNAIGGAVHMSRAGLLSSKKVGRVPKSTTFNEVTLKPTKEGMVEVKLSKEQVKKISELPKEKQSEAILAEFKKGTDKKKKVVNADATLDDIEGLNDTNLKIRKKFWQWFDKGIIEKGKVLPEDAVTETKAHLGIVDRKNKNSWLTGTSQTNQEYLMNLEGTPSYEVKRTVRRQLGEVYKPKTIKYKDKTITFSSDEVKAIAKKEKSLADLLQEKAPSLTHDEAVQMMQKFEQQPNRKYYTWNEKVEGDIPKGATRSEKGKVTKTEGKDGVVPYMELSRTDIYGPKRRFVPITSGIINTPWGGSNFEWEEIPESIPVTNQTPRPRYIWAAANQPAFKKGGIIKAQTGEDTEEIQTPKSKAEQRITELEGIENRTPLQEKELQFWKASNAFDKDITDTSAEGNPLGKKYQIDPTSVLNVIRGINAGKDVDKQLENFKNRPRYHMSAPMWNVPRFISSGTGDAYRNQANRLRMYKPTTSDAVTNEMLRQQLNQSAFNAEMQGQLADSKEFAQYLKDVNKSYWDYQAKLTDIANQNRKFDWQYDIENTKMENASIAEKSQIFDKAATAVQSHIKDQLDLRHEIAGLNKYNDELTKITKDYKTAKARIGQQYPDKNSTAYAEAIAELNAIFQSKVHGLAGVQKEAQLTWPFQFKSGGKTSKKVIHSKDITAELLLQNAKNSSRFVEKLNDSVIKMLLQVKPINVS